MNDSIMGLLARWTLFLFLTGAVAGGHVMLLTDGGPPETLPTEESESPQSYAAISSTAIDPGVVNGLDGGYPLAWDAYRQRISHDVLKGDYYRQQLREQQVERESTDASIDPIVGNLRNASRASEDYLAETVSVESLLLTGATADTAFEPVYQLYELNRWSNAMFEVSSELRTAQENAFAQMESVIESDARVDSRTVESNPGALSAGQALAYYRYVAEFGDEREGRRAETYVQRIGEGPMIYREEGLVVVEWRKGGNVTCPMMDPCQYEGDVQWYEGASARYAGGARLGLEVDRRYRNRVYYVETRFPRWLTVYDAHLLTSSTLEGFLTGGTHFENPIARRGVGVEVEPRVLTGPSADPCPCVPPEAKLASVDRPPSDHRRLRSFENVSERKLRALESRGERLDEVYVQLYDGNAEESSRVPPGLRQQIARYWYLRTLLESVRDGYNEGAYDADRRRYVDTETRIQAQQQLLDRFGSAEEFEAHVDGEIAALDRGLDRMESNADDRPLVSLPGIERMVDRYVDFTRSHAFGPLLAGVDLGLGVLFGFQFLRLLFATVASVVTRSG